MPVRVFAPGFAITRPTLPLQLGRNGDPVHAVLVLAFVGLEEAGPPKSDERVNCNDSQSKSRKGDQNHCGKKRPQNLARNHGSPATSMFVG